MSTQKEKSYTNLVHFKADTYERPEYAEHHRLTCELMKKIREHKFNTYDDNFQLYLCNPEDKLMDVNYFRGMFSIGSIYLYRENTPAKTMSIGHISIYFDYKNTYSISFAMNSPLQESLFYFTEESKRVESTKQGEIKDPIEFIQHCLDRSNKMVTDLINILSGKS